jgi:hypothetical protein
MSEVITRDKEQASITPRAIGIPSFQTSDVFLDKSQANSSALVIDRDANGVNTNRRTVGDVLRH